MGGKKKIYFNKYVDVSLLYGVENKYGNVFLLSLFFKLS